MIFLVSRFIIDRFIIIMNLLNFYFIGYTNYRRVLLKLQNHIICQFMALHCILHKRVL